MYGLEKGNVVEKSRWSDVLLAENPVAESNVAHVDVTDIMTFSDGNVRTSNFQEGYFANTDGSVGERFYEIMGQKIVFKKLTANDWTFQSTPSAWEYQSFGIDPKSVLSGSHVTTKTTTYEGSIDTDHVTRVTTLQWKDAQGSNKSDQFISMKGSHVRVLVDSQK